MKSQLLSMTLLLASSIAMTPLWATTINFDDQTTGQSAGGAVQLTTQYASSGVIFNDIYAAQNFVFNINPPSAPNYASPFWTDSNPGTITFVDPVNAAINATVNTVSFTLVGLTATTLHPGNLSGATIEALDLSGNVIVGQTEIIPATDVTTTNQILTFTGAIHELEFIQTNGTTGAFPIDNLVFGAVTATPEPSSFGLFGIGLGLLLAGERTKLKERR